MWILLNESISNKFKNENNYTYLFPINRNNFMIGKNNSGKSYFMRFIIKNLIDIYISRDQLIHEIKQFIHESNITMDLYKTIEIKEIKDICEKYDNYLIMLNKIIDSGVENGSSVWGAKSYKRHNYTNAQELINEVKDLMCFLGFANYGTETFDSEIYNNQQNIKNKIVEDFNKKIIEVFDKIDDSKIPLLGTFLNNIGFINLPKRKFKEYYFPTIRGLRNPIKDIHENIIQEDIYKKRIVAEYAFNENIEINTGLDFYKSYKEGLLGKKEDRNKISEFEKFLSQYFFDGADISIIPDEKYFELKINVNDETEDRYIFEVGDGISSMIILMYPIFIEASEDNYNLFFIEEPENSFHPGFQRLLISVLTNNERFKKCIFFYSTHSNHLIDIGTNEMKNSNVYLCKKNNDNSMEIKYQNDEFNEVIEELGVQASSVRIANKVIWVEGKYDAFYIRLLLNLKNSTQKYIEDYDYCFLPYGGSNMKLIEFVSSNSEEKNEEFIVKANIINPKYMVVLDADDIEDNKNANKYKRYIKLKEKLGDRIYKLEVREIENLFPESVLESFIYNNIKDKSKINDLKLDYNLYKNKKLGEFINKELLKIYEGSDLNSITGRKNGFENDGFLYNKQKYYDEVLSWTRSKDFSYENDVPEEAKRLIEIIENFIKE